MAATIALLVAIAPTTSAFNLKIYGNHAPSELISTTGIDEEDLMEGAHWKKNWPEGNTDPGDGDEDVLNLRAERKVRKHKVKDATVYPEVKIDQEIIDSQNNLEKTEQKLGAKFGKEAWWDRGRQILNANGDANKGPVL